MINLYQIDCMDFMKDKPDKFYDLAIVDPPYGIGIFTTEFHTDNGKRIKNNKNYSDKYTWNDSTPKIAYFNELRRVSKDRIIWGANYYNEFENENGALVWNKGEMTKTLSQCEIASLSFQKKVSYVYINWQSGFYRKNKEGSQIHPCQKPIALYKWILQNYAKPGQKILDTHGGSMSIAIACYDLGFDLDLCELDSDYFEAGKKRFETHVKKCEEIKSLGFAKTELNKNHPTLF